MKAITEASRVTAAICAYNPPPVFHELVRRLGRHEFHTTVIDDGSRPALRLEPACDRARLVPCPTNIGLAAARNLALENVTTEWIFFVDSDVVPDDAFLARLPALLAETDVDGVGFNVRENYRTSDWDFYRANERDSASGAGPVEWVSGLLCAYRTEALRAIGGFDPRLQTNGEDVDLGFRLTHAGRRLVQMSDVCGVHHRKDSLRSFLRMHYRYALTAKLVDRSHYFPQPEPAASGPVPLFRGQSIWPQLRLFGSFLKRRPWAFYVPPLVAAAMFAGARAGRRVCKQGRRREVWPRPRMNLAIP